MNRVRVAVIGNGNLGRWHCQKAHQIESIDFVGVVDISQEALDKAKEQYPYIATCRCVDDIMDKIDAAVVVTPISTHFDIVKKFLSAGKHVFCEKSATETLEQISEIKKILDQKSDLVFQVGHSERYQQIWEDLSQYDEFLTVGDSSVRINRYGPFRGRDADVSVVEDLLIHDVDLLLNLFHEMPIEVNARGYKIRSSRWDHVSVDFYYKNGRKVSVDVGRNHVEVVRNFEMINSKGCMKIDFLNNSFSFAANNSDLNHVCENRDYPKRDHLYLEQVDFASSILEGTAVKVNLSAAYDAIRLLDKVLQSLSSGKTVQV